MIEIRQENKNDYEEVYQVVKTAFESAEHSDGNEHDLVDLLRKSDNFIPELSLVATSNGKIVGYIMFTKVKIGDSIQLALAPLAVLPEYQRKGIGSTLIKEGHKIANDLGYDYSIVLGSEKYYPKMGYLPAINYRIMPSFEVPNENFMACKLNEKAANISGIVEYAKEFGI
ncbi:GNAT family N-acetyltransferase [Erysipelatoclostridium sp. An15]|uniref:GNAT family N-acetyltransferase n=1 Tax=Erysipelatoclostridium sp. An15 TaxID=1965566 RepID=UPI001EF4578D|nr:N-acetyltransferase [Erysipelatoclostridium sp. An15]